LPTILHRLTRGCGSVLIFDLDHWRLRSVNAKRRISWARTLLNTGRD
jgi:hypothetical protein